MHIFHKWTQWGESQFIRYQFLGGGNYFQFRHCETCGKTEKRVV